MGVSRRQFLGSSAAAVLVAGTMAKGKVFGANERVTFGCMGIHGQGGSHMKNLIDEADAEVVALCDADKNVLARRQKEATAKQKSEPKTYVDVRDMLADDSIDAITIATPNHWHALAAIWGCQAGKDVYVEKPSSWDYWEGKQLIAAAKKHGRVVQHGTQQRSSGTQMRDVQLMRDGIIGDIVLSRGCVYKNGNRGPVGHGKPGDPPDHLDWNLWQGPAEEGPYLVNEGGSGLCVHYDWHWFWQYGNGEIGNQGVHQMDVACWTAGKGLPSKVYSSGGRYGWDDDAETPNTQATTYTYADGTILEFEVRNMGSYDEGEAGNCTNTAFGTTGYWIQGKGFHKYKNQTHEKIKPDVAPPESRNKWANFIKAIRSRNPEDNVAPPEVSHIACAHICFGNIAYRVGRSLQFDPLTEAFVGDEEATAMLRRQYREPFVVPEIV